MPMRYLPKSYTGQNWSTNSARRAMLTQQACKCKKACAEYKPTDDFPYTFYKGIVSDVSLYRDTHIEFKLRNGQTV